MANHTAFFAFVQDLYDDLIANDWVVAKVPDYVPRAGRYPNSHYESIPVEDAKEYGVPIISRDEMLTNREAVRWTVRELLSSILDCRYDEREDDAKK